MPEYEKANQMTNSAPGGQTCETLPGSYGKVVSIGSTKNPEADSYIIDKLFTYHPATPFTGPKFETIREAAKYFAKVLLNNVPAGADRTAAIRKLREAVMTANAGISLGGLSL